MKNNICKILILVIFLSSLNLNSLFAAVDSSNIEYSGSWDSSYVGAGTTQDSSGVVMVSDFASAQDAGWKVDKVATANAELDENLVVPPQVLDFKTKRDKLKSSFVDKLRNRSTRQHLILPQGVIKKRTVGLSAQDAPVYDSQIVASPEYLVFDAVELSF